MTRNPPAVEPRGVILLIDDDASVLRYLTRTLENVGYGVRTANNGRDGLEAYRNERADLVITDLFMEQQEGLETIRMLRALDPKAMIIAMTGGSLSFPGDYLGMAMKLGAAATMVKPFDRETVLRTVQDLLSL